MRFFRNDKGCWRELDDNIIYYQNDNGHFYDKSHLIIKNIQTNETLEYFNIVPKNLRLLNKQNSYFNILIETFKQSIIGKLDTTSLNLRMKYKICQETLFYKVPIYDFDNNIFHIIQERKLIQMRRNKFIRKYKGRHEKILENSIITRLGLSQYNQIGVEDWFFEQFQVIVKKLLNISCFDIQYEKQAFKRQGDFIILKQHTKYSIKKEIHLNYYLSINQILKGGDGLKGRIFLDKFETLKTLKCLNNCLYVVINQDVFIKIYQIKSEYQKELIFSAFHIFDIKKPILQHKHLIFTNKSNRNVPGKQEINFKVKYKTIE